MLNTIKPPLGVAPHWFVYNERMRELNEAVQRHLEHAAKYQAVEKQKERYQAIASWCDEIKALAMLEAKLEG
jgi:hypothetical protein